MSVPAHTLMLSVLVLASGPAFAVGVDPARPTRADRLESLYADQIQFGPGGEPLISVGVLRGRRKVVFTAPGPIALAPGDTPDNRIIAPAGTRWTLTLEEPHRGKTRSWVIAERFSGSNLERVATAHARWRGMGHEVSVFQGGALVGIGGQTLDTRAVTIAISPAANRRLARKKATRLAGRARILGTIHDEYLERPGGWIVAREATTGVTIRARDLLSISPVDDGEITLTGVDWPRHGKGDRRYRGRMYALVGTDRRLTMVNLVSAETLLEGVVPSEIFPNAPADALKAQAVAARGMLISKVGVRHRGDPYQLCGEPHCQSYTGAGSATPQTTAAVQATRGKVLVDSGGFTDTVYHSACGGHTEAWHVMWGGSPDASMPGVSDAPGPGGKVTARRVARFIQHPPQAWCAPTGRRSKVFRWTVKRTGARITKAVNAREKIGPVHSIRPLERGRSGRVLAVEYVGRDGRHVARGATLNRRILGGLKSGLWIASRQGGALDGEPTEWTFQGGGFGHGVGMCQHGAMGLARAGRSYEAILDHYYPTSRIMDAW